MTVEKEIPVIVEEFYPETRSDVFSQAESPEPSNYFSQPGRGISS